MSGAFPKFEIVWGMAIDVDKCTGCGACMVSCQAENNVNLSVDASNKLRTATWMLVYEASNGKAFPEHDTAYFPRPCMHCGKPSCVSVCPANVTKKDEVGGIVSQVYPRCFGCRYCMASCPYHARYFNWYDPIWPKGMEKTLNPDVSVRPRGVVEKCTFCHHRFMQAKDKAIRAGGDPMDIGDPMDPDNESRYITACAEACPNGAIMFGDIKNPDHAIYKLLWGDQDPELVRAFIDHGGIPKDSPIYKAAQHGGHGGGHGEEGGHGEGEVHRNENVFRLLEELGTDPQVFYVSKREWVRKMGNQLTMNSNNEQHS